MTTPEKNLLNLSPILDMRLATDSAQAKQQLRLALLNLAYFRQTATHYRNQLLGRALDSSQNLYLDTDPDFVDLWPDISTPTSTQALQLTATPIAGWDFSLLPNLVSQTDTNPSEASPVFEPEFAERANYLLGEIAQAMTQEGPTAALLAVDHLDLLLTLVKAEAIRIVENLESSQDTSKERNRDEDPNRPEGQA